MKASEMLAILIKTIAENGDVNVYKEAEEWDKFGTPDRLWKMKLVKWDDETFLIVN